MVRVISVHHFTQQDVRCLDQAMTCAVTKGNDDVLLVGGEHQIDICDLKYGGQSQGNFPTVDLVQQLIHCETGNYICTLEAKPARTGSNYTYVRVYLNWNLKENQPMKARIAGKVTPSCHSNNDSSEIIEIGPLKKPSEFIACCQTTGNLAVASGMSICLFQFCYRTLEKSKVKYIDFIEFLEIDVPFVIKEIAIAEDILGCISESEAHVFQLAPSCYLNKLGTEDIKCTETETAEVFLMPRSRSPQGCRLKCRIPRISESQNQREGTVIRDAHCFVDVSKLKWKPTMSYASRSKVDSRFMLFPSLVGIAQCGSATETGDTLGPASSSQFTNVKVRLVNQGMKNKATGNFEAVILIHKLGDQVADPDIPFSNIKLVNIFSDKGSKALHRHSQSSNPLVPSDSSRSGVSVFITTPHVGHLYHITLSEDYFKSSVLLGAVFSYTAPVYTVALEPFLLHALTLTGLETYTIRPHPQIVVSHLPESFDMIVPSHWEEAVCLVGLRPFLNVESLTLTNSCLALVAFSNEGEDSCRTLYSLHLPSPEDLYKEMIRVGRSHQSSSNSMYLHLLLEAYLVLTTALNRVETEGNLNEICTLTALLEESSALLGDYYTNCLSEIEWEQAVQYYQVSKLSPDIVIERLTEEAPGIVYVLTELLLVPGSPLLTFDQANFVLDTLEKIAPDKVSMIILKSPCLKKYKHEKVLAVMKQELAKTSEPRPTDVMALALVFVERGLHEQVLTTLASLRHGQLLESLYTYSFILCRIEGTDIYFSPLAKVLVEHRHDVFIDIFVLIIGEGSLTLDSFVDAYIQEYPVVSCGVECNMNSLRLRDFLESFFLEFGEDAEVMKSQSTRNAVSVLISLYLAGLVGAFNSQKAVGIKTPEQRAVATGAIYGDRPSFLDLMPPFNGNSLASICKNGSSKNNSGDQCLCSLCFVNLLVLQSLMSSNLPSYEDRQTVLKFARANPSVCGSASLQVLSLEPLEQITFLIKEYPKVLPQYARDIYKDSSEWKPVITKLIDFKSSLQDDSVREVYTDILTEMLTELVVLAPFDVFVAILPKDSHGEYRSFIRQSHTSALTECIKDTFKQYAMNSLKQMEK